MKKIRTYYDNLQVVENASPEVIKGAYKYLSQRWHPDKNPENREKAERITRIINRAYEVLSDVDKRRQHDAWIAEQKKSQGEDPYAPQRERQEEDPYSPLRPGDSIKSTDKNEFSGGASGVRPWVRFWARLFDMQIFSLLSGVSLGVLFPGTISAIDQLGLLSIAILFTFVFVEALLLSIFGTTPGKALFRISLIKKENSGFDYKDGLSRSIKVWWRGLGAGIPFIQIITMMVAYNKLSSNSCTSWDADEGIIVRHDEIGYFRIIFFVVFFSTTFIFIFLEILAQRALSI